MSDWAPKRFWKASSVQATDDGYSVHLDGRPVRTPAKALLSVPGKDLAAAIAMEWDAQEDKVDPGTMPLTRLANSVSDKVVPQQAAVAAMLAEYGGSDLLCYRADGPEGLVSRQISAWTPFLDWAEAEEKISLSLQTGIMPVAQPQAAMKRITAIAQDLDPFSLTSFHEMVTLSGSFVLGLAVLRGAFDAETAWEAAIVDETWQTEQWGEDEEASTAAARKRAAFMTGHEFGVLAAKR